MAKRLASRKLRLMLKTRVARFASALHHRLWLTRAVTLGVRTVVLGPRGIFLVRHVYVAGWYLPGGGVDRGESAEAAAVRELREEGGLKCLGRPALHGFYRNGRRDHVACYVVRDVEVAGPATHAWEIAEAGWFASDGLPEGTTPATRARIMEVLGNHEAAPDW